MTLMEVVFSIAVLVLGMSVCLTAFSFAGRAVYTARNQVRSMNFVREQVESRRHVPFRDPLLNVGTYTVTSGLYRASVVVSSPRPKEKNVRVSVVWTNFVLRSTSTATYETIIVDAIH